MSQNNTLQLKIGRWKLRKERFYNLLYELTKNACELCAVTGCKCTDRICSHVEQMAQKEGHNFKHHKLTNLRFIGTGGCVVPPHLRETCTIYLCEYAQNKPGFDRKRYEKLVRICQKIDWILLQITC